MERLIENGAIVSYKDVFNHNIINMIILNKVANIDAKKEMIELVLERGAELSYSDFDKGYNPLHYAIEKESDEIVALLIEKDPGLLDSINTIDCDTPLHLAAKGNNTELIEYLLNKDAKVITNNNGITALHSAITNSNKRAAELLKDNYSPDTEAPFTLYDYASYMNHHKNDSITKEIMEMFYNKTEAKYNTFGIEKNLHSWYCDNSIVLNTITATLLSKLSSFIGFDLYKVAQYVITNSYTSFTGTIVSDTGEPTNKLESWLVDGALGCIGGGVSKLFFDYLIVCNDKWEYNDLVFNSTQELYYYNKEYNIMEGSNYVSLGDCLPGHKLIGRANYTGIEHSYCEARAPIGINRIIDALEYPTIGAGISGLIYVALKNSIGAMGKLLLAIPPIVTSAYAAIKYFEEEPTKPIKQPVNDNPKEMMVAKEIKSKFDSTLASCKRLYDQEFDTHEIIKEHELANSDAQKQFNFMIQLLSQCKEGIENLHEKCKEVYGTKIIEHATNNMKCGKVEDPVYEHIPPFCIDSNYYLNSHQWGDYKYEWVDSSQINKAPMIGDTSDIRDEL